jgi:hypothetical protein
MSSLSSDNWQELLAGYVLGDLSPEEVETFQQLVAADPDLNREVLHLQETLALMPYALPDEDPPAYLKQSILAAAEATQPDPVLTAVPSDPQPAQPAQPRRPWRLIAGGAIAAAALIVLGADNYQLRQSVAEKREVIQALQNPDRFIYTLSGTEDLPDAFGSLVIDTGAQRAFLLTQNLPPLPSDQAYRLWAIPEGATAPAFCGQFDGGEDGLETRWQLLDADCNITGVQMLITAEDTSAPPAPEGPLVMQSL